MKLVVTQENLSKALSLVGRVAGGSRGSLPVLQNVLLKAKGSQLTLSATNLEIAMSLSVGAKIETEGSITIPARLSQDFIASLPSGTIELSLDGTQLHIATENYSSVINGVPAEEFPALPEISSSEQLSLPAEVLKKAVQQVIVAASHDETRPVLTGLWLHTYEKNLFLVATDSYRLAEKQIMPYEGEVSLLVPVTAMQDVLRVLSDTEEEVIVQFDDQQVLFRTGTIELTSRLIDGTYPDYRQLIPKETTVTAMLPKSDLINITKVSSLFAKESAGSITLHISEEDQTVGINSIASQVGENKAVAKGEIVGDLEVSLNSRYLLDALGVIGEDQVTLRCAGKTAPCLIQSVGKKQPQDYTHIIMPLRS